MRVASAQPGQAGSHVAHEPGLTPFRAIVVGAGSVGSQVARQLLSLGAVDRLVLVDQDRARSVAVAASLGPPAVAETWSSGLVEDADVAVLTFPGDQQPLTQLAITHRLHVVSSADGENEVQGLLELDGLARQHSCHVVAGAAFSPGLTCLLATHAAGLLEEVDEVRIARSGAGGPACAATRRRLLTQPGLDWRNCAWSRHPGGTGRELCWFPEPVGGRDCFRGGLADALLLTPAFPSASRVTTRTASSRWERMSARAGIALPVRSASGQRRARVGSLGAVRVEVRGRRGQGRDGVVLGAIDRPEVAAGTVAAIAAIWAFHGRLSRTGVAGLAELVDEPASFLRELAERGVRAAAFDPDANGWRQD